MATTIRIKNYTREKLKRFGHEGESYDDIIERLMDCSEELNIEERWERLRIEKEQYIPLDEI